MPWPLVPFLLLAGTWSGRAIIAVAWSIVAYYEPFLISILALCLSATAVLMFDPGGLVYKIVGPVGPDETRSHWIPCFWAAGFAVLAVRAILA